MGGDGECKGRVPRDLRETVKKTPGVKGWVRTLEEPVRQFLIEQGEAKEPDADKSESDFSDDEVVFVGRKGVPRDGGGREGWKMAHREVHDRQVDRGMIFDSLEDDESGAFKYVLLGYQAVLMMNLPLTSSNRRWLTHSVSGYYGLKSRSVTMGNPARRCVYVGIRDVDLRKGSHICPELPRPLWELF